MTTATREKATAEVNGGAELAEKWTPVRIVRELASSSASLYGWLSGPPSTELERSRATLTNVSNGLGRKILFILPWTRSYTGTAPCPLSGALFICAGYRGGRRRCHSVAC